MSKKIEKIVSDLKTLTLFEAAELVKEIEKTFNIDTSTKFNNAIPMEIQNSEKNKSEEKTEFEVILDEVPKK